MNRYLLVLFVGAVMLGGIYTRFIREDETAYILRVGKLDDRWRAIVQTASSQIIDPTLDAGRHTPKEGTKSRPIGFFIFDSRLSDVRSSKVNSCGFYPSSNNIFCDVRFIDTFLGQRDLDKEIVPFQGDRSLDVLFELRSASDEGYDALRLFMLQWVLAHEFGHFMSGHRASHFGPSPLDVQVQAKSVSQANEIEADLFLISRFDPNVGAGEMFYANLIYLLNIEIHRKACPGLSPLQYCDKITPGVGIFSPTVSLLFKTTGSHPEYMIRLVRLIKAAHEKYDLKGIGYLNDQIVRHFEEQP